MRHYRLKVCVIALIGCVSFLQPGVLSGQSGNNPPDLSDRWVDSVMNTLDLDERIAQLLNIRAYSNRGVDHVEAVADLIKKYKIGGLTFFQGGPMRQAQLTNYYQGLSEVPLMIALDAEWGLGMRLDSCFSYPYQMTLGAMTNDSLVYAMASEIARQLTCIGVGMNFAPVVDINNNPANPVIHVRSFGEDKLNVAAKGTAYMKGLQDHGLLTTAKHFPGHGDTDADSHHTLPVIPHSPQRLDSVELYPFKQLINNGLSGIMTAHLYIPSIDTSGSVPASLSGPVITGLLQDELGFSGLLVTDALDMKGVTASLQKGEIEYRALLAGNDILLLPQDVPAAISRIKQAVTEGALAAEVIDSHCRKVLRYKYKAGLASWSPVPLTRLMDTLDSPENIRIERAVYREAVTLVWNPDTLLPLHHSDTLRLASLSINTAGLTAFQLMLGQYTAIDHFVIPQVPNAAETEKIRQKLTQYDAVVVGIHDLPTWQKSIDSRIMDIIHAVKASTPLIVAVFGNPYMLSSFTDLENVKGIILAYQDVAASEEITAQMLFGSMPFKGRLPVTASGLFTVNSGMTTASNGRLMFVTPEEMGIGQAVLRQVDDMVTKAITDSVFPGCQVIAFKDGKVFYNKCFGHHTYDRTVRVTPSDLYDIASITKVAATTMAVMKLDQEGKIDIDRSLGEYLPYLRGTDKGTVIIREMMAHQARLLPWIKFYDKAVLDGKPDTSVFRDHISEQFPMRVCEGLYIHRDYMHRMFDTIVRSRLLEKQAYKYSDLGFYLLKEVIENVTNMPLDVYVTRNFYLPMGLSTMTYRPRERFPLSRIVPTELDMEFRQRLVHGDVHDPGAAMLGGVSGHAGLFSNAGDLAVILQMLLQKGHYAGIRYLDSVLVKAYTRYQFPLTNNRRGVGFDKPERGSSSNGPACASASEMSFGHSGFTGTYIWADPQNNLGYVFLSNRVYPTATNNKLIEQQLRTRIHELFYQALRPSSD